MEGTVNLTSPGQDEACPSLKLDLAPGLDIGTVSGQHSRDVWPPSRAAPRVSCPRRAPGGRCFLKNAALRQQLVVALGSHGRPRLRATDRAFWVLLRRGWRGWRDALVIVRPATVVRWHRHGFRLYWHWKSRRRWPGRPRVAAELRELVRQMARENTGWGAPRIHGELLKLGFEISERTVSRGDAAEYATALAELADLSDEPRRRAHLDRLLRRAHRDVPPGVCARDSEARATSRRSCQCDRVSDGRVDRAADRERISMGHRATLPAAGSRRHLRRRLQEPGGRGWGFSW